MAEGARLESVYTATYRGFESPPHRHIRDESLYASTGSFLLYSPQGGMRTPDRGSTTGAASWTDRARSKRAAPQGRAKRVNPPSPPYFKKSSYACTGFFFACGTADIPGVGSNASPGLPDPTRQVVRPRAVPPGSESIPPPRHILRRARTHVRAFFRMWHRRHPRGRQQCLSRATRPYPPGSPAKRSAAGRMPKNNKARASPGLAHSMTINNRLSASAGREPSARSHRW